MALILPDTGALFYEIPKTGTTWVRVALKHWQIRWEEADADGLVMRRHALPEHYKAPFNFRFASIRHPLSWYQSWYCHVLSGRHNRAAPSRWRIYGLVGEKMDLPFQEWLGGVLERQPAFLTRMYEAVCGPLGFERLNAVLRQENLADDLREVLAKLGYEIDAEDPPPENESPDTDTHYPDELKQRVLAGERALIDRWYSDWSEVDAGREIQEVL